MLDKLKEDLLKCANPEKAKILSKFFKTGKGQYGEGDVFLGVTVPEQQRIATKYPEISLKDLRHLLRDKTHEHRLVALLLLIIRYRKANETGKGKIFDFYLRNTKNINNWDLVDLSAERILGDYLLKRDRSILYRLAK